MKVNYPVAAAAAIGIGAAVALALPAGAAVSVQSESPSVAAVRLGGTARLDANGAVVFAPLTIACTRGVPSYLTVKITQNVGGNIASGSTNRTIRTCNGKSAPIQVSVTPTNKPFAKGVAFGQASLEVCGSRGCVTAEDERVIQIR